MHTEPAILLCVPSRTVPQLLTTLTECGLHNVTPLPIITLEPVQTDLRQLTGYTYALLASAYAAEQLCIQLNHCGMTDMPQLLSAGRSVTEVLQQYGRRPLYQAQSQYNLQTLCDEFIRWSGEEDFLARSVLLCGSEQPHLTPSQARQLTTISLYNTVPLPTAAVSQIWSQKQYTYIIFGSPLCVRQMRRSIDSLNGATVLCIGARTAAAVKDLFHDVPDDQIYVPDGVYSYRSVAEQLVEIESFRGSPDRSADR